MDIYAPLTNYDAFGSRWTKCHTVRVRPQYATPVAEWRRGQGRRPKPVGYEIYDTLGHAFRYVDTMSHAAEQIAEILDARPRLQWGAWQPQPDGTLLTRNYGDPAFIVDLSVATRHRGGEFAGLFHVALTISGPDTYTSEWLSPLRHLDHRTLNVKTVAEHHVALMAKRFGIPR